MFKRSSPLATNKRRYFCGLLPPSWGLLSLPFASLWELSLCWGMIGERFTSCLPLSLDTWLALRTFYSIAVKSPHRKIASIRVTDGCYWSLRNECTSA